MGIAHGSIQAAASWPKHNGLINVLDGAGTHPGAQLDRRPCLRRRLPVESYQRTGARAAIELSSCNERQTITDNSGL